MKWLSTVTMTTKGHSQFWSSLPYGHTLNVIVTTWFLTCFYWSGAAASKPCRNGYSLTSTCLIQYFNESHQTIPSELRDLLSSKKQRSRRHHHNGKSSLKSLHDLRRRTPSLDYSKRRKDIERESLYFETQSEGARHRRHRTYEVFNDEWCSPFSEFLTCMEEAVEVCRPSKYYRCIFLNDFVVPYGNIICGHDLTDLVKSNATNCRPKRKAPQTGSHSSNSSSSQFPSTAVFIHLVTMVTATWLIHGLL